MNSRLVSAEQRDDDPAEASLRPQRLGEFIGQQRARANLSVFIEAAKARKEALDHVLLVGPPVSGLISLVTIGPSLITFLAMMMAFICMIVAGSVSAAAGFGLNQYSVAVPIVASIAASFAAHAIGFSFVSLSRISSSQWFYLSVFILYATFALLPWLLCCYLTRKFVRSTWQHSAEPAR